MENPNFWDVHGVIFIACMFFFTPDFVVFLRGLRWDLLVAGLDIHAPLLVAILATIHYADTNIVLVVFAWVWAFVFEIAEKTGVKKAKP